MYWCRHLLADQLGIMIYHGKRRHDAKADITQNDIVLTTYETLRQDWMAKGLLFRQKWYRIVLDEGII